MIFARQFCSNEHNLQPPNVKTKAQVFAPLLFGLLIDGVGAAALWVTSLLGVAALAALWMLRPVVRQ